MTEAELLGLSRDREPVAAGLWSSQVYGVGKWLKRYAGYPDDLPLCAETDHGPGNATHPHKIFLETKAPVMLYHNADVARAYRFFSSTPCEIMGSPFAYYRWMNGLVIRADAAGTLAFPSHSTHHVRPRLDWRLYCRELRRIPERFRPVTVCLYWKDILDGLHKVFLEEGFEVVTAGHIYDEGFVERFYGILARHRFATSNEVCTAGIYAVEMGLPFFLWGEQDHDYFNSGGEPCLPKDAFRVADVVGYYALDTEAIGRLRAEGIPESVAAGLAGLAGRRVRDSGEFLAMLGRHAGIGLTGPVRDAILKRAAVPQNPKRDRTPFLQPSGTVSAAQAAYADRYLGIHTALRPSQLRELLWASLDEAVLGKAGAVRRVFPTLRRHVHDPASGVRACPACGSFESKPETLADTPDSPAAGTFRLCLDCGTCSRTPSLPRPETLAGSLRREEVGGAIRITGVESSPSPLEELKVLVREAGTNTVQVLAPALCGSGPSAILYDAGIRTLFSVTGMRRLLRRAGLAALSACQDPDGRIDAVGRASGGGYPAFHASPEPAEGILRARDGSRGKPSGSDLPAPLSGLADGPQRLAALLSELMLRPGAPEIHKALAELYFRVGAHAASEAWLGLYTERLPKGRPDPSAYDLMDQLRLHLGFGKVSREPAEATGKGTGWIPAPAEEDGESLGLIVKVIEALSQDRNSDALELIRAGLDAGLVDAELPYARAIALDRLERRDEAIEALEGLLAAHPGHAEARNMLARLSVGRRER